MWWFYDEGCKLPEALDEHEGKLEIARGSCQDFRTAPSNVRMALKKKNLSSKMTRFLSVELGGGSATTVCVITRIVAKITEWKKGEREKVDSLRAAMHEGDGRRITSRFAILGRTYMGITKLSEVVEEMAESARSTLFQIRIR
ncbi:hypothetical protein U1Q18_042335 [Sarracenia purpurea var. burkii]